MVSQCLPQSSWPQTYTVHSLNTPKWSIWLSGEGFDKDTALIRSGQRNPSLTSLSHPARVGQLFLLTGSKGRYRHSILSVATLRGPCAYSLDSQEFSATSLSPPVEGKTVTEESISVSHSPQHSPRQAPGSQGGPTDLLVVVLPSTWAHTWRHTKWSTCCNIYVTALLGVREVDWALKR